MTDGLAQAQDLVHRHHLGPEWVGILAAFQAGDVGAVDATRVPARIEAVLAEEVDADQAALFARRYRQVVSLLASIDAPEARVLELLLPHRACGLLAAPPPRALRVRALVDFVFSHAAVVATRDPLAPSPADRVRDARWVDVAPGVAHATIEGPTCEGPVHINLLRLDDVHLDALDSCPDGDLVAACHEHGAVAGFSGGFFLYSEPDIDHPATRGDPVGTLVRGGAVLGAPVLRRGTLVQRDDGSLSIEVLGPEDATFLVGGRSLRPTATNDPTASTPCAFNRAWGPTAPEGPAVAISHGQVVAVGRGALPIPLAGLVLRVPEGTVAQVGDPVEVHVAGVHTAMAGGPRLLGPEGLCLPAEDFAGSAPPVTFSQDETFDTNRLPRLAAGLTPSGRLFVVAVDGRNLQRAPGLTLAQTGGLLRAVGCEQAVNLDGGSSKRMVVSGRVVDLPSTEVVTGSTQARVRPVRSAVLVTTAAGR